MALSRFSTDEMVALTRTWVEPGHRDRALLSSREVTAALLPELEAAHRGVLTLQAPEAQRLDEIQDQQQSVDARHDRLLRAMWYRLLSEEQLAADHPTLATELADVRDLLLPQGLATTQRSYREQVGHGVRVGALLSDRQRQLLQSISTLDGTLMDVVARWQHAAKQLGELDHERNGLLPVVGSGTRGANLRRRRRWARAVALIRMNGALLADDSDMVELLGRIDKAELDRARRVARASDDEGEGEGGEVPAPSPGEDLPGQPVAEPGDASSVAEPAADDLGDAA